MSTPTTTFSRLAIFFTILITLAANSTGQNILINEINTGDPDFIELANNGLTAVNLSGWQVETGFAYTLYPTYTIPSGITLAPGECIVLIESNSALSFNSPTPPATAQVLNTGLNLGWVGNSSGCVALIDPTGTCQDLVVFGTSGVAIPASAAGHPFSNPINRSGNNASTDDVIYRVSGVDTNTGADWANSSDGSETPGTANLGQVLGPVDITNIVLDLASHPELILDAVNGTFSINAQIKELHTFSGIVIDNNASDALVGGTIVASGSYFAPNGNSLAGMILSPATVSLRTSDQTDQLILTTLFQTTSSLSHQLVGATPTAVRELVSSSSVSTTRIGSGSRALDSIAAFLATETISMVVRDGSGHPEILSMTRSYQAPAPTFDAAIEDLGTGQLSLGAVGVPAGHSLYNIFALNSSTPLGSGPLLGITLGSFQLTQIALPVGHAPFHVWADSNGNYSFVTPTNVVPMGLVLDCVTFAVNGGSLATTPPSRLSF